MMTSFKAVYLETNASGDLDSKIAEARSILEDCVLCPRKCRVNRSQGETGICKTGANAVVCSFHPHFGEESPLVGAHGSGTIFFSHCNLLCNFCQNYEISHGGEGREVSDGQLARMMLALQQEGCHNINFVTPSHVVPQILSALKIAVSAGLHLPLVYNTSAYDQVETLGLLEGVFDIYMPDFKFWDPEMALLTCQARDYPEVARTALAEMQRQVGDLVMDANGLARRGILLRHLVLPDDLAGTREIMGFVYKNISPHTYVNIMPQYRPCGRAWETKGLNRAITAAEFEAAIQAAAGAGIIRFDQRRWR